MPERCGSVLTRAPVAARASRKRPKERSFGRSKEWVRRFGANATSARDTPVATPATGGDGADEACDGPFARGAWFFGEGWRSGASRPGAAAAGLGPLGVQGPAAHTPPSRHEGERGSAPRSFAPEPGGLSGPRTDPRTRRARPRRPARTVRRGDRPPTRTRHPRPGRRTLRPLPRRAPDGGGRRARRRAGRPGQPEAVRTRPGQRLESPHEDDFHHRSGREDL